MLLRIPLFEYQVFPLGKSLSLTHIVNMLLLSSHDGEILSIFFLLFRRVIFQICALFRNVFQSL